MRGTSAVWVAAMFAMGGCGVEAEEPGAELSEPDLASTESAVTCSRWSISLPDGTAECNACGVSPPCSATQYSTSQSRCVYADKWCTRSYRRFGTINQTSPTAAYYFNPSGSWGWSSWVCTYYRQC